MVRILEALDPIVGSWRSIMADIIRLQVPDEARLPADPDTVGYYCCKL